MKNLSSGDKHNRDDALQRLLDMDGYVLEQGGGYWVEFKITKVAPSKLKPHGIDYSLCLLSPDDKCLLRFDNAHPIKVKGKVTATNDHVHKGRRVRPYIYIDPEELMIDFWTAVEEILEGVGK